jgi:hypothetical protein
VVRRAFPRFNHWLANLPDPRCQIMCRYEAAHLWWHILAIYLFRTGSRNAFDEKRNSGAAPWNMGLLCGQSAEDPRFAGQPTVTGSDNAKRHANRVDPDRVRNIPLQMIQLLLQRRMFDGPRLFDHWYVVLVDGTVQEKCRQGFTGDGKSASGEARYRYVLQALFLGPDNKVFSFLHEFVDRHNPQTQKEDCELIAFYRLSQRLKACFPRPPASSPWPEPGARDTASKTPSTPAQPDPPGLDATLCRNSLAPTARRQCEWGRGEVNNAGWGSGRRS